MSNDCSKYLQRAKRLVVKVGSGVLTEDQGLNLRAIADISSQICGLIDKGLEVVLVSSGAMAAGLRKVGMAARPDEIPQRQAIAAVGQAGLILAYENAFGQAHKKVAQVLLTQDDLSDRKRYLNARNTLHTLLSWRIVPIINENDTVVTEELKFGDNDNLSAMIALLMDADFLINLTDIDGLYTKDPRLFPDATRISEVTVINRRIEKLASDIPGALGTGGMLSKIKAAKKVTAAGVPMIIAKGTQADILTRLFDGEPNGTFFVPAAERLASRKCWIAFTLKPRGTILLDDGAVDAIKHKGKSLLPIGIVDVKGDFGIGECVEFSDLDQTRIGLGLVNYSAADVRKIKGLKSAVIQKNLGFKAYDEVIHRDNLALVER